MKSLLTSIGLVLFYPIWLVCALLSDLGSILCTPFDTQRLVNTYIQTIRNGQQLGLVWEPTPQSQPEPPKVQKIGFAAVPPEDPEIYGPVCKK